VPDAERAFNRPLLATISRKWQRAIERRSLGALKLKSTELDECETIMTSAAPIHSPSAVLANKSICWPTNQIWSIQQDAHQRCNF
jgi:hypothetical protein